MDSKKDAFGRAMWEYYKGEEVTEIIERDDGYIDTGKIAPAGYFSDYKKWPVHMKKAMKFARGRILDIGCGAGRHSLYLQDNGLKTTGIDTSPLAIKICKRRGLKQAKLMSIEGVKNFRKGSFETIIMMGNNFGLLGNPKKAKRLLKLFRKITTENARIIAESSDPYKTKNPEHKKYHERNKRKGRLPGQVKIRVRFHEYITDWLEFLFVSKKEMKDIIRGTGWYVKKFIDSEASIYIAIIEKA